MLGFLFDVSSLLFIVCCGLFLVPRHCRSSLASQALANEAVVSDNLSHAFCLLSVVCGLSSVVRGPWSVVRGPSSVVRGPSSVVRGLSSVVSPYLCSSQPLYMEKLRLNLHAPWSEVRELLKEANIELTDEDLNYEPGREDELLTRLESKLGKSKSQVKAYIESVSSNRGIAG